MWIVLRFALFIRLSTGLVLVLFKNVFCFLFFMIDRSFCFLPKIRVRSERKLWSQGINSWDDFLGSKSVKGLNRARKELFDWKLADAKVALKNRDELFFSKVVPFSEQWRLFDEFKDEAVYLDIETDGYYGCITVIGLSDGVETKTLVRGFNLDRELLRKELSKYKLLVTFNGASFDMPVINRYFGLKTNMLHVDLRFVCQKVGYVGGLKAIEKEIGIRRRPEVENFCGEDAVSLWENWRASGDREHLDKLVWYNEEDILNLKPLAKKVIPLLWQKTRHLTI